MRRTASLLSKTLVCLFLLLLLGLVLLLGWLLEGMRQRELATQALIPAVKSHSTVRVQLLLQEGADPNVEDKPLQPVSWLALFKRLFHRSPPGKSSYPTALGIAAQSNDVPIMRLLILKGARVNVVVDGQGRSVLLRVASWPDLLVDGVPRYTLKGRALAAQTDMVNLLLAHGALVNATDKGGVSALMEAVMEGYSDMAALLLAHGAQAYVKDKDGSTALMSAVAISNTDIDNNNLAKIELFLTKLLLAHGAQVNAKDDYGRTALMEAYEPAVIRVLLAHGAQINAKDKDGQTALLGALQWDGSVDDTSTAKTLLLAHGVQVNVKDKDGRTALMEAAHNITVERLLLARGAQVNVRDKDGTTALMDAAAGDASDVTRLLLAHGAQINIKDKHGKTALDIARDNDSRQVARLLRQAGVR
jgi:serine/threonine-protein phosphatase 6 regulatory ankyrin repeat subunit A/serine/threonine-protein phosphatase 6 regulatory ankyrin repeat subunit B